MPIAQLTTTSRLRTVALRGDVRALRGRFAGRDAGSASVHAMAEAVEPEAQARATRRLPTKGKTRAG
jgi:hypothetical protein